MFILSIFLQKKLFKGSRPEEFYTKGVLKNFVSACSFIKKETLAQVFSYEFCEIFKNTFFVEHLRATASD